MELTNIDPHIDSINLSKYQKDNLDRLDKVRNSIKINELVILKKYRKFAQWFTEVLMTCDKRFRVIRDNMLNSLYNIYEYLYDVFRFKNLRSSEIVEIKLKSLISRVQSLTVDNKINMFSGKNCLRVEKCLVEILMSNKDQRNKILSSN